MNTYTGAHVGQTRPQLLSSFPHKADIRGLELCNGTNLIILEAEETTLHVTKALHGKRVFCGWIIMLCQLFEKLRDISRELLWI